MFLWIIFVISVLFWIIRVVLSELCGGPKKSPHTFILCSYYSNPQDCVLLWFIYVISVLFWIIRVVLSVLRGSLKSLPTLSSYVLIIPILRIVCFCGSFVLFLSCFGLSELFCLCCVAALKVSPHFHLMFLLFQFSGLCAFVVHLCYFCLVLDYQSCFVCAAWRP